MRYLLDTDVVIDHLAGDPSTTELVASVTRQGTAISIVAYMEVWEGILRSGDPGLAAEGFTRFLESSPILQFSTATAQRCAMVREALRQAGRNTRRRALDLMVAATAIEHGLTLVTRNTQDYKDIPNLIIHRAGPTAR